MKAKTLRIFELVLVLSIAFLPSLIISIYTLVTGSLINYTYFSYESYLVNISNSILAIVLMYYVLIRNNRSFKDIGLSMKFTGRDFLIGFVLLIVAGIIRTVFINVISLKFPFFASQASNPQNIGFLKTHAYGFIFFIAVIVPIEEELIVRGFTMTEIFNLTGSKNLAIVLSVLIQFSYHLYQGIAPALMTIPVFIVFSVYFIRTGRLNPIIMAHVLIDVLSLILKR